MTMTLAKIEEFVREKIDEPTGGNYVPEDIAISPECVSLKMFDAPLVGAASCGDKMWVKLCEEGIIGSHFILPNEWLPDAVSVISIFFPFTERVSKSCADTPAWPSPEWLHARTEGEEFIFEVTLALADELSRTGHPSLVPPKDARFKSVRHLGSNPEMPGLSYTSVWSERHVAYVCGLGTFSLSKGLITKRGGAGRFGSVITSLDLPPIEREYSGVYDYCVMCGACVRVCPAQAITLKGGKDHSICALFGDETKKKFNPRYGCGKCQVGMPCQSRAPGKNGRPKAAPAS
ncbi:(Fe-S)-binding protein [Synergistales bacterium]|nr:(Fe-S)-binding protein [Synergistales bacterium]